MEAKDTVMDEAELQKGYCEGCYDVEYLIKRQAEISFKLVLEALVKPLGFTIDNGHIVKVHDEYAPNQTCQGYEIEEICEATPENVFKLIKSLGIREVVEFAEKFLTLAEHGDYANGNDAFGVDEGRVRAGELLDSYRTEWKAKLKEWGIKICARCGAVRTDDVDSDICGSCADDLRTGNGD